MVTLQGQFFSMNGHFISFDKLLPLRTSFTINWIQSRENLVLKYARNFFFGLCFSPHPMMLVVLVVIVAMTTDLAAPTSPFPRFSCLKT